MKRRFGRFLSPRFTASLPEFCRRVTLPLPQLRIGIPLRCCVASGSKMGTTLDHRRCAEECVAMARLAGDTKDKALWLTLAQSWVRLAEHAAHAETSLTLKLEDDQTV